MIAADRFDEGKKPAEIAAFLGVDDQSVRHWRRVYVRAGGGDAGRAALRSRKPIGRPRKLTDQQRAELRSLLVSKPWEHGYADAYFWTTKLIARLIKDKFGVEHHHDHVGVILHELDVTPQIPARRAKERDEAKITQWREELWPELLKKVPRKTARSSRPTRSGS